MVQLVEGNYESIVDEIYSLREAKQNAQVDNAEHEGMKQGISEMQQFLAEQTQNITEYDEQLVSLIEKITVYNERVTVEFKSGTSVDVRRQYFYGTHLAVMQGVFLLLFCNISCEGFVFCRIQRYNKLSYLCQN